MKKLSIFLILLIFAGNVFAAENLVLSCEGTLITVNGDKESSPIKNVESYSFKDGKLLKGRQAIKCTWSDEEIRCDDMAGKPYSVNRLISINRITGYIDSMTSYVDGKGEFIRSDVFTGTCKESKRKF